MLSIIKHTTHDSSTCVSINKISLENLRRYRHDRSFDVGEWKMRTCIHRIIIDELLSCTAVRFSYCKVDEQTIFNLSKYFEFIEPKSRRASQMTCTFAEKKKENRSFHLRQTTLNLCEIDLFCQFIFQVCRVWVELFWRYCWHYSPSYVLVARTSWVNSNSLIRNLLENINETSTEFDHEFWRHNINKPQSIFILGNFCGLWKIPMRRFFNFLRMFVK